MKKYSMRKRNNLRKKSKKVRGSKKNKDIQTVSITSLTSHAENNHLDYFDLKLKTAEFNRLKL